MSPPVPETIDALQSLSHFSGHLRNHVLALRLTADQLDGLLGVVEANRRDDRLSLPLPGIGPFLSGQLVAARTNDIPVALPKAARHWTAYSGIRGAGLVPVHPTVRAELEPGGSPVADPRLELSGDELNFRTPSWGTRRVPIVHWLRLRLMLADDADVQDLIDRLATAPPEVFEPVFCGLLEHGLSPAGTPRNERRPLPRLRLPEDVLARLLESSDREVRARTLAQLGDLAVGPRTRPAQQR